MTCFHCLWCVCRKTSCCCVHVTEYGVGGGIVVKLSRNRQGSVVWESLICEIGRRSFLVYFCMIVNKLSIQVYPPVEYVHIEKVLSWFVNLKLKKYIFLGWHTTDWLINIQTHQQRERARNGQTTYMHQIEVLISRYSVFEYLFKRIKKPSKVSALNLFDNLTM